MRQSERSCSACRTRRPKADLIRFARTSSGVEFDPVGDLNGRGGYTCRDAACVEGALVKGGLARTLRTRIPADRAGRLSEEAKDYLLGGSV